MIKLYRAADGRLLVNCECYKAGWLISEDNGKSWVNTHPLIATLLVAAGTYKLVGNNYKQMSGVI